MVELFKSYIERLKPEMGQSVKNRTSCKPRTGSCGATAKSRPIQCDVVIIGMQLVLEALKFKMLRGTEPITDHLIPIY